MDEARLEILYNIYHNKENYYPPNSAAIRSLVLTGYLANGDKRGEYVVTIKGCQAIAMPTTPTINGALTLSLPYLLLDIALLGLESKYFELGHVVPTKELVKQLMEVGKNALAEEFMYNKVTEFRLNGCGLKLFIDYYIGTLCIGGDQARDYPRFVREVNEKLKKEGFQDG